VALDYIIMEINFMTKEKQVIASLTCFPRVGSRFISQVKWRCDEIGISLSDFYFTTKDELREDFVFLTDKFIENFLKYRNEVYYNVGIELKTIEQKLGGNVISIYDECYPKRFIDSLGIYSPPLIYTYGNLRLLDNSTTGIVGSRSASNNGLECADYVSRLKTLQGNVIVSGYAKGIDYTAHRSCLYNGGKTIFVLSYPLLEFRNKIFKDSVLKKNELNEENVLILSEFLKNSFISKKSMPIIRNRLISALSDELIIIEADSESGTMNTAKKSMELGKPLYVIDYSGIKKNPSGNNDLIKKGVDKVNYLDLLQRKRKKNVM
jgi:DNA processing protein